MLQNFHASVEYCCPIWLVKANNTSTQPMLITPSLHMVDTILLYVCTLSLSMSEWFIFALFSVFIGFWPHHCFKLVGLILCALMCCPFGAHTLCFNVLSLGDHTLCFISRKPIMPIIQRRVWKYQRDNQNRRTTTYTYNKGQHIKVHSMCPTGTAH
jgi:hypothetical protein